MGRIALAVIAGYFLTGILVVATDRLFALFIPGMGAAAQPPAYYFGLSLVTDSLYSLAGGYYCAAIAAAGGVVDSARKARWALIAFGAVMGITSQVMFWNSVPHWYGVGLLILFPIGVWMGVDLRMRGNRAAAENGEAGKKPVDTIPTSR